jgi:dTDP-4-dehydrorhamnose reductase
MKVAVIGANGQLGTDVVRAFADNGDEVCALTHADLEVANIESVSACLRPMRPDVIVNTAAMHHVENCESEPEKACPHCTGVGRGSDACQHRLRL